MVKLCSDVPIYQCSSVCKCFECEASGKCEACFKFGCTKFPIKEGEAV